MSQNELISEFLLAARQGDVNTLKACLENGVDINCTNRQGRTAITLASLNKHYEAVSFFNFCRCGYR